MANIIFPKPWHDRNLKPVDEEVYYNRRTIIKQLGIVTGGILASSAAFPACSNSNGKDGGGSHQDSNNTFNFPGMEDLYPAERNNSYKLDRPITEEYHATHYNNFYEFIHPRDSNIYNSYKYVDKFDTRDWTIEVSGHCNNKGEYNLEDLMKRFPLEERLYRHRCVETWSMAVPWTGFPFADLVKFLEPTGKANYVRMISYSNEDEMPGVKHQQWYPWPYFEGLRMDEAMNELSFMVTGLFGKPLPKQNGAPVRLVTPWKYGYKSIKSVIKIEFVSSKPETFWHKVAPGEYGFYSNVNPNVPHPRWSQKMENMIPDGDPRPTLLYNGYAGQVAHMYS